jgi:hypothetical protein
MHYPKIDYDNKSYVCWCGKQAHFLEVTTTGGYHPEIGKELYFAWSNGCKHDAPINHNQFVYLNLDSWKTLTDHETQQNILRNHTS